MVVYAQADPEGAASPAEAALAIANEIGDRDLTALAIHMLGLAELTRGRWDNAEVLMTETLRLQREIGVPGYGAMALQALSSAARGRGDLELSARRAEEALAIFRAAGHASGAAMALANLARVAVDRGDDRRALSAYQDGLSLWASIGERWAIVRALAGVASLAATYGAPEHAATLIGAIDDRLDEGGSILFPSDRPLYDRAVSTARAALGEERFGELRAAGRTLPMREVVAIAAAVSVPDPSAGRTERTERGVSPLTAREREVLRLLAAGQTEQEIADALFVGRRTVNTHVANILGKLGVASRREAALRARGMGLLSETGDASPYT